MKVARNLSQKDHPVKQRVAQLRSQGATQEAAAREAGCSRRTVEYWETTADAQYWAYYEVERKKRTEDGASEAWLVLRRELQSDDAGIRLRAASRIMDSADRQAPQKMDVTMRGGMVIYHPEPERSDEEPECE